MPVEQIKIASVEHWLRLRLNDYTASVAGALFGLHPFTTIGQVAAEKRGLGKDQKETAVLRRGRRLETLVADLVGEKFPDWEIWKNEFYFRDPDKRMGATPDFFIDAPDRDGRGVLQTKTVAASAMKRSWADQPPFWVMLQIQQEMFLSGCTWGVVAVLPVSEYSDFEPETFLVELHMGAVQRIIVAIALFWQAFDAGEAPQIDYERDNKLLGLLYPSETKGKIVDLSGDNRMRELLSQHEQLGELFDEAKKKLDACDTEIKAKLGDAESALVPGWRVTWKEQQRKAYSVAASSFRVLRVKNLEQKETDE